MSVLSALTDALASATVEVIDLTAPLSSSTPILKLPPPFSNTVTFALHEISRYDDRGPAWYWNDITTGEHTGTHFDAPNHWVTGQALDDVAAVPASRLIGPAVVIDRTAESAADPDYLLDAAGITAWEAEHGALPAGGWLLYRTGWSSRGNDPAAFANADASGPHTPGMTADAARYLAQTAILGLGVETVGTDAGAAHGFEPAFPCHQFLLGAGKYGLTQLRNIDRLPVTGAMVIAAPLPIVNGSGSPCRVLALVAR